MISTHAPARGATQNRFFYFKELTQISTHAPARGATVIGDDGSYIRLISTHAPARGATITPANTKSGLSISTHAPARGATACQSPVSLIRTYFNSRTHEGCDSKNRQKSLDTFVCLCTTCRIKSTYNSDLSMLTTIILSF